MSDAGRKDWSDKLKESAVPDSSKSTQTKVKETFTDTGDKLARGTQPDSDKSAGQSFTDKVRTSSPGVITPLLTTTSGRPLQG